MTDIAPDRRRKPGGGAIAIALIITAALVFILVSALQGFAPQPVDTRAGRTFNCTVESVYDGDGPINCEERDAEGKQVRVRLSGIEAREADNSCRNVERCPEASGAEAKAQLTRLAVGRLECVSRGPSYSRVAASCRTASGSDLSCEMLRTGTVVRLAEYDPEGQLIPCVPSARSQARS